MVEEQNIIDKNKLHQFVLNELSKRISMIDKAHSIWFLC